MKKTDFITSVEAKKGFVRVIKDEIAPDNIVDDFLEKRYLTVQHLNADQTMGITYIFYVYNKNTDDANFYNQEPENLDVKEETVEVKRLRRMENHLKTKYRAYFINRFDLANFWAEAEVYVQTADKVTKKTVLVLKEGTNPIMDIDVI